MSDTPRTDGLLAYVRAGMPADMIPHQDVDALANFARALERELAKANEVIAEEQTARQEAQWAAGGALERERGLREYAEQCRANALLEHINVATGFPYDEILDRWLAEIDLEHDRTGYSIQELQGLYLALSAALSIPSAPTNYCAAVKNDETGGGLCVLPKGHEGDHVGQFGHPFKSPLGVGNDLGLLGGKLAALARSLYKATGYSDSDSFIIGGVRSDLQDLSEKLLSVPSQVNSEKP